MLVNLVLLYAAFIVTIYIHELGHFGKKIKIKFFPPVGMSVAGRWRLGGLIANLLVAGLIFLWKPDLLFIQYIGLTSWIHFILYSIIGSFNVDAGYIDGVRVWDDVDNRAKFLFVPAGILVAVTGWNYFVPVLIGVFT